MVLAQPWLEQWLGQPTLEIMLELLAYSAGSYVVLVLQWLERSTMRSYILYCDSWLILRAATLSTLGLFSGQLRCPLLAYSAGSYVVHSWLILRAATLSTLGLFCGQLRCPLLAYSAGGYVVLAQPWLGQPTMEIVQCTCILQHLPTTLPPVPLCHPLFPLNTSPLSS